jgi:hypothetical protein
MTMEWRASLLKGMAIAVSVVMYAVLNTQNAHAMPIHQSPGILALKDAGVSVAYVQQDFSWRWRYSRSDTTPSVQPNQQPAQRPLIQSNPDTPITKPAVIREKAIATNVQGALEDAFLAHQVALLMTKSPAVAKAQLVQSLQSSGITATQANALLQEIQHGQVSAPSPVVVQGLTAIAKP